MIDKAAAEFKAAFSIAQGLASVTAESDYNVIRYSSHKKTVAFLLYDAFFDDPFPILRSSCLVDLITKKITHSDFTAHTNPPVLHRKELLLPPDHPIAAESFALTSLLEEAGLFENSQFIGTQHAWRERLTDAGYDWLFDDPTARYNKLVELATRPTSIARHRTAISRYVLSRPLQWLEKHGYLDNNYSLFDYGCGKGDDLRGLNELGIDATGWDPHFRSTAELTPADIVNLGYVVNVIEDANERATTIQKAFDLAGTLLVVSAQLHSANTGVHQSYKDGVLTSRSTFQKYFSHSELDDFIQAALDIEPIAVAPGIYFIFKDKIAEQGFLEARQRSQILRRPRIYIPRPSESEKQQVLYERHKEVLDSVWARWLELGRVPFPDEINAGLTPLLEDFGSLKRVCRFLVGLNGEDAITVAAEQRVDDLLVYFALNLFHGRPRYKEQPLRLQRDIKSFFRNHTTAIEQAQALLFSVSDPDLLLKECESAYESGLGFLDDEHSLTLHVSQVNTLPAVLRVYVGCASNLYGDLENADLVKIHITSGKLSVMVYDEFNHSPLPRLVERVKIKMREQDIDFFDYGEEFPPPYLYDKSKYLPKSFPSFQEQVEFEKQLAQLTFLNDTKHRLSAEDFDSALKFQNLQIDGFQLSLRSGPKSLDQPCGQYLTYRDLIECGETQSETKIENTPKEFESFCALYDLATHILDPVIDYFGMIRLTYGFCSPELSKKIPGRVAPELDQHASYELKKSGKPVCSRLGAAIDFIVEDEDMHEVAVWVIENTDFDRLYFYGRNKPIHVSFGPDNTGQIVLLLPLDESKLRPRVISIAAFKNSECVASATMVPDDLIH